MTGYMWRDPARVSPARLAELSVWDTDAGAGAYRAARESGLRVWEAAIAAGVSQSVGRRLEKFRRQAVAS